MPIRWRRDVDRPPTDHCDGRRFFNPGRPMTTGVCDLLTWMVTRRRGPWPGFRPNASQDLPPERVAGADLRICFVGHATVLLQTAGINLLTDPVWSQRASPLRWAGPKRVHPPGIDFDALPPIDAVLVSHNHYDHLDLATITRISRRDRARVIVPAGNDTTILRHDQSVRVSAYDWGEGDDISADVRVELRPLQHWSARGVFDRNRALWAAYVITTPAGNIYFAGDTGYGNGEHFRIVKEEFGPFFLALLPIGCSKPEWFMQYQHMGPADAVRAFYDLGEPFVLPTHHSTFPLADNGYSDPLDNLALALENDPRAGRFFLPLAAGEMHLFSKGESEPENRQNDGQ